MNIQNSTCRAMLLVGAFLGLFGHPAHAALSFKGIPLATYQLGNGPTVRHGLAVDASTYFPRLIAGGSFVAWCEADFTYTFGRERELSSSLFFQRNVLLVTIPEQLPAYANMPGFELLERGRSMNCNLDWKAWAEEPTYTMSVGGTNMTIHGDRQKTDGRERFIMNKPGTATGEDDACLP